MKKLGMFCVALCTVLALSTGLFADQTQDYAVSVTFPQGDPTSYEIYDNETGGAVITSIPLNPNGVTLGTDVKKTVGKIYIQINRGDDDSWALSSCTKNTSITEPLLVRNGDPTKTVIWKYRNHTIFGKDTDPIGTTISDEDWSTTNLKYKYFVNSPSGCSSIPSGAKDYAEIANSSYVSTDRIQITFGIDFSSGSRSGLYGTTVEYELLTN